MNDPTARPPNTPETVGPWRLVRVLGVGGMGEVYEAVHAQLGLRAAIKTLKPALAANAVIAQRFHREAVVSARVRHPNAVAVYDVIASRAGAALVMEYLDGETLKDRFDREGVLTPASAVDLLLPVASAVAAAHEEGVVHRDLKPSNLFLARERTGLITPKVLDFGLSWAADDERHKEDITRSGVVLGTLLYMAPEQVRNARQASAFSDQYALGVILYQLVTGARPFLRETQFEMMNAVVAGTHTPPRALRPELPAELDAVIERAMHVDAAQRFPSVHAFARAMLPFASPHVQALWAPVFDARAPAVAPVSSLPAVPAPVTWERTEHVDTPPFTPWLARSPSRALVLGGAACVLSLALGIAIGASSSPPAPTPHPAEAHAPDTHAPPADTHAQPAMVAQPAVAQPLAAPPPPAVAPARLPVVQQLRVDPAVLAAAPPAPSDAGVYVPHYSRPQFLDRMQQQQVLAAPDAGVRRRH